MSGRDALKSRCRLGRSTLPYQSVNERIERTQFHYLSLNLKTQSEAARRKNESKRSGALLIYFYTTLTDLVKYKLKFSTTSFVTSSRESNPGP
jgi:hypothetical protein